MSLFKDEEEEGNAGALPLGYRYQNLYARETHPDGIPHDSTSTAYKNGKFDATLEEVLHLINAAGHAYAYRSRLVVLYLHILFVNISICSFNLESVESTFLRQNFRSFFRKII